MIKYLYDYMRPIVYARKGEMRMKKCKQCGKKYAVSEIYCPQCGSLTAKEPARALAERLHKPIRFGNSNITLLAILWIVAAL